MPHQGPNVPQSNGREKNVDTQHIILQLNLLKFNDSVV